MKLLKQFFALAVILSALTSLTACNTMHGAGKDIERGGEKLKDAAD
jgi:predicted small secreted protein